MAGGNHPKGSSNKPSSSSSSHRKSRWESGNNTPAGEKSSVAVDSKPPQPPSTSKPSPSTKHNPTPKLNPNPSPSHPNPLSNPSPRPGSAPFPENLGPPLPPPPAYGFHMLERRTIYLADGSVRSYFALPPDYQDFSPPPRHPMDPSGRFLPHGPELGLGFGRQFPPGGPIREDPFRHQNQDYWNSLGLESSHKRKYSDGGERSGRREEREGNDVKDEFARQRQQLLQYGNAVPIPNGHMAGPSSPFIRDVVEMGRGDEMRPAKYMRSDGEYGNLQGRHGGIGGNVPLNKYNKVDQSALKKAFMHYLKLVNENATQKNNYLADGKQGPLQCLACGRSSNDFPDVHGLIMHTYNSSDQIQDHLGLHKALCILMGWNYLMPPDNSKAYQLFSAEEAAANQDDLILWPPMVIIHNTITGKGRDGRVEDLGNKAMDNKLRDLGFSSGKSKSIYGREGHMGTTLVKFAGDQSGLKEAMRLTEFFEKENHGRRAWDGVQSALTSGMDEENNPNLVKVDKKTGEKERILYGYLGTVFDLDKVDFDTRKKVAIESRTEYQPPR